MSPMFAALLLTLIPVATAQSGAGASAQSSTPVGKVITLLEDMKTNAETEASDEATSYGKFACFCKDTTATKSTSITDGKDEIDVLSAEIEDKTASKAQKSSELQDRKAKLEALTKELASEKARCAKEKSGYEASAADLSKALAALQNAIGALEDSKPTLIQTISNSVEEMLNLADAMGLITAPKHQAVSGFIQQKVDPNDPEYKYHSQGIINTLGKLLTDFKAEKKDLDDEWAKTKQACEDTIKSLGDKIDENSGAINTLETDIDILRGDIADARDSLIQQEIDLKDDQSYLKDLTERCENRAKDFDQRSSMRGKEIEALSQALTVLKGTVKAKDEEANKRALFIQRAKDFLTANHVTDKASPSFLQLRSAPAKAQAKAALVQQQGSLSLAARQERVSGFLQLEGNRLSSQLLSQISRRAAADPFTKVKKLIQELIERLLNEATAEATKKGFCDTQLGKAEKDREHRFLEAKGLNVAIAALEVKQDELELEIDVLKQDIGILEINLANATSLRSDEKSVNMETLKDAKEGLSGVNEAIVILKAFYRESAKATALLQASPVDEDTDGPGFSGAYTGNLSGSKGVIGLLEVIQSDFQRTIRQTEASEKKAQDEFVEFDRVSKADISGKETKLKLDEEDLATTKSSITSKTSDLRSTMDLLDAAVKVIEGLKPTCIDTGMSYADRVAKREDEIASLKKALCILDTDQVEADCPSR